MGIIRKEFINFDFATSHSTGFYIKEKLLRKLDIMILNLDVLQITIFI